MRKGYDMVDGKTFIQRVIKGQARWTYLYLFLIPFINWCFAAVPTIPLPDHGEWTPMSIVTGLVLVVRDFAQREVGHWIFIALLLGLGMSYFTSPHDIAWASTCAFAVSELIDWSLFTFLKLPLSKRVFISAGISAPIDSTVFYLMASSMIPGLLNPYSVASSIGSKLVGCLIVYWLMKRREKKMALAATA